jgi:hypothetical protein
VACPEGSREDYAMRRCKAQVLETTDSWKFLDFFAELRGNSAPGRAIRQAIYRTARHEVQPPHMR